MQAIIDLRSDTVTRPSKAMRAALADAVVGDDVLGDDPTVALLESEVASLLGKPAGLFMPSGTMSNTVAIMSQTKPGDEVLLDRDAHTMRYEAGGAAALAGVVLRQFSSARGVPNPDEIRASIQSETLHAPATRLIVLENTHNVAGGSVIPLSVHEAVYATARERGVAVHIDGARLFHASIATGVALRDFAATCDTVTVCLSKGLGCPVGSVLCGPAPVIARARRIRKMLGGGMRQVGILAAAGLYAIRHNIDRLVVDHTHARRLAEALETLPGVDVDMATVQTNMVYFSTVAPARNWVQALRDRNVWCLDMSLHRVRLVTHMDVDGRDVDAACDHLASVAQELSAIRA